MNSVRIMIVPPEGRVRVSAPRDLSDARLAEALTRRLPWIREKRALVRGRSVPNAARLVSGEAVLFEGKELRLRVIEAAGRQAASLDAGGELLLKTRPGSTREERERLLERWYRARLKERIPPLLAAWEGKVGKAVADWGVKRMKTRWGTCNAGSRRIWLNLELVKRQPPCLEYVVVHELVHLLERGHGPRFAARMDALLPDWRERRRLLAAASSGSPPPEDENGGP